MVGATVPMHADLGNLPCAFANNISNNIMEDSLIYGLFQRTHTESNIKCCWKIVNLVKDALWSVRYLLVFQYKKAP